MKRISKADYDYTIDTIRDYKVLAIIDLNKGGMSVTNDIENVVAEICQHENVKPEEHLIVYKDSEGTWDGWDGRDFVFLGEDNMLDAVYKYQLMNKV